MKRTFRKTLQALVAEARAIIALCGIILLGVGLWHVSWALALIVLGVLLVIIALAPLIVPLFRGRP